MTDENSNPQDTAGAVSADAPSDEQLMADFAAGSREAFGEIFTRYKQPLFGFFRRRVREPAQAEELTQETFLVLLHEPAKYQPRATFRTYLYAVGFNILRAHRRKAAFRATFFLQDAREPASHPMLESEIAMRDAVSKLDRDDREVLLLREYEQLSYAEIAEVLKMPLNTVRSRLFRARTGLRAILTAPAPTASGTRFPLEERA